MIRKGYQESGRPSAQQIVTFNEKVPARPEASVTAEPAAKAKTPEDAKKYKALIGTMHTDPRDMRIYKFKGLKFEIGQ